MTERHLTRRGKTNCRRCNGHKAIMSKGPHGPAMDVCDRCNGAGEVWEDSLTLEELNEIPPIRYERNDF